MKSYKYGCVKFIKNPVNLQEIRPIDEVIARFFRNN